MGGNQSFTKGAGFLLFTQADNNPGVYADAAARDAYFGANPSELARLDENEFLVIKLLDDGAGSVAYQQRAGGVWRDVTSLTQGDTGPAGATGNSYFFSSIAARDAFFNTSPNEGLLENGLPVTANIGDSTTSEFIWGGTTAPPSYDSTLWRLSAKEISSGTLFLGVGGSSISSGSEVLNFIAADGDTFTVHGVAYDDSGSTAPAYWKYPAIADVPLSDVDTDTLTDPQTVTLVNTLNFNVKSYKITPATSGEMRLQTWLAATEAGGPELVDTYVTVLPGDIGVQTEYIVPNNTLVKLGQTTFTKFSGVQLKGGLQTTGSFIGLTVPAITIVGWGGTQVNFVTEDDGVVTDDTLVANYLVKGAGAKEISLASSDGGVSGARFDATNDSLIVRTPAASTGGYVIEDSAGDQKMCWAYSDSLDDLSADFEATTNSLISTVGSLRFQSNAEDLTFKTLAKDIIIESADKVNVTGTNGITLDSTTDIKEIKPLTFGDGSVQAMATDTEWNIGILEERSDSGVLPQITTGPRGLTTAKNGTRLYACDINTVYQYDLSTPNDIDTLTYSTKSFASTGPVVEFDISPDGTLAWFMSFVVQFQWFTLSTPFELDSAGAVSTYNPPALPTATASKVLAGGRKAYFLDSTNQLLYEWEMSIPYAFGTLTDTGRSFAVGAGTTGLEMSCDARYLFITKNSFSLDFYEFDEPGNVESLRDGVSPPALPVVASELAVSNDGAKMFSIGSDFTIYEMLMGRKADSGLSITMKNGETRKIVFNTASLTPAASVEWNDATKELSIDGTGDVLINGNTKILSDGTDIEVKSGVGTSGDIAIKNSSDGFEIALVYNEAADESDLIVNSPFTIEGTDDILLNSVGGNIELTTPSGDVLINGNIASTIEDIEQLVVRPGQIGHIDPIGLVAQEDTSTPMNAPLLAIDLAPDGTKYFVCGNAPQIYRYDMTAPFDITTGSYFGDSTFNAGFSITGLSISPDGRNMLTVAGPGSVRFWTMATPYDFDNAVQGATVAPSELVGSWTGCDSSGDGRHLYLTEAGFVRHYTRNGWSDQSLTYAESFAIAGGGTTQTAAVSSDGRILYWNNSSVIREYTLTTQWDVSTAVLTEQINGVMNSLSRDIRVSPDGTKLYGGSTDTTFGAMNEYNLGLTVEGDMLIKSGELYLRPATNETVGVKLLDSSGILQCVTEYSDILDETLTVVTGDYEIVSTTGDLFLKSTLGLIDIESATNNVNITSNFEILLTSNNGDIVLTAPNGSINISSDGNTDILSTANGRTDIRKDITGTDTFPILRLDNQLSATNPGTVNMHVGNRDPNGVVTGTPNDLYFRQDGANSAIYYCLVAGTVWHKIFTEGFNSITLPAGEALTIDGTYTTDTPVLVLDNSSGTGGASVRLIPTTTNPQGTDTGQIGDIRIRKSGVDSTAYMHVDTIANNDWVDFSAGSVLMFGASNIGLTTTLRYMNPYDMFQTAPTSRIEMVAPRDGFLRNLHVYHGITGVGFNVTYTVYLNGTLVTALSVTMAVSDILAKDTNGFIPVTESDRISVRAQMSNPATTSPSKISITMELV